MAVAVFGKLQFPPKRLAQVLPHLRTLVEATRANDGCSPMTSLRICSTRADPILRTVARSRVA